MSDNPLQKLFRSFEKLSNCIQTHLYNFTAEPHHPSPTTKMPLFSVSSSSKVNPAYNDTYIVQPKDTLIKGKSAAPVTKEELGRCTWTFLHTLAAQYPENPTRQQKRDVKELMAILSRMYPCKDCADHFKEVLRLKCTFTTIRYPVTTLGAKANPVQAGSQADFSQWLCHVHNVVNRSLGKLVFPCERVDARWGKLECEQRACDLLGSTTDFGKD